MAAAAPTVAFAAPSPVSEAKPLQSRAAMAALAAAPGTRVSLSGEVTPWEWQSGDFAARVRSDPLHGLYQPHATIPAGTGCWVRIWDGITGHPEWFGARTGDASFDSLPALTACHALCRKMRLSPGDYHIRDTFVFHRSSREIEGAPGSGRDVGNGLPTPMGVAGGTRIILTGPKVANATVFRFGAANTGSGDDTSIMRNSVARSFAVVRDCATTRVEPSPTPDPIDCAKGVVVCYQNACRMEDVFSFDSPVGFHYVGVVYSHFIRLSAYRSTPASRRANDFWIGHLIGGYSVNYYIAANASIYFQALTCYDAHGAFGLSIGIRVFGYISDTFIDTPEVGRVNIGIEIDGRDKSGATVKGASSAAHQDVRISNAVVDSVSITGIQVRNLNPSGEVTLIEPYIAAGNAGVLCLNVFDADGKLRVAGGRILGGGIGANIARANQFQLEGTYIRDCPRPVVLDTVGMSLITPAIYNPTQYSATGIEMTGTTIRCHVAPQIRAGKSKMLNGVTMTSACAYNEINLTMIDPGAFVTVNAAFKVRFDGRDARGGAAGSNVTSGVQG